MPPVEPKMKATPYRKMADAKEPRMKYFKAASLEKEGIAKANVIKATGQAEAQSDREKGMADAQVIAARGESNAKAEREVGLAKAEVTRAHFQAEADGLVEKFNAMGSMSKEAREHEEFRRIEDARRQRREAEGWARKGR